MRILHVVPSYIPAWRYGGPIHSVHGLCAGLARRGHTVTVATTNVDGPENSDVPLGTPVDIDGVAVHYFPSTHLRRLYFSPPLLSFLKAAAEGHDLIHTHSVFLFPTSAAAHVARKLGKPYVLSPRGMLVRDLIERRSGLAKRAWIALFEGRNVARAAAVHSTSTLETEEMLALGLNPKRVFELPNGIDLAADPAPGPREPQAGHPYLLFLGRISWKKGLDRLLEALAASPQVHAVIAGNDEEGYLPVLERLAAGLSIAERIRFVGYVEGDAKKRLISGATALVLPSYSENFGNVVVEAMAQGTPVVVTPEVGLARFVAGNDCGLVAAGGPAELGGALRRIWDDPGLRARLGANGRRAAREHFSWDGIARKFEENYGLALDGNR